MNNLPKRKYNRIILNDKDYINHDNDYSHLYQYNSKNALSYQDCLRMSKENYIRIKKSKCKVAYYDKAVLSCITEMSFELLNKILSMKSVIDNNKGNVNDSNSHHAIKENLALRFDSHFESGNLLLALGQTVTEYDLVIRPELNTNVLYHWFFFKIIINRNLIKSGTMIKFNIINFTKDKVLFNNSVPILCYYNNQWTRDTFNVYYYLNNYKIDTNAPYTSTNSNSNSNNTNATSSSSSSQYSTLTFCFEYHHNDNNEYYFAYCYPYTYSQLEHYLNNISQLIKSNIIRFGSIGKTIEQNKLHLIVISDFNDSAKEINSRPSIILTSRVHPGESNSSYVIQGVIDFLINDSKESALLRKMFIWKIIPMLNPDGVINGNYRMNLSGRDLNRAWIDASIDSSPSVYYMKELIKTTLNSRPIYMYCDFHGHSKKSNFFLYSCRKEDNAFNDNYHLINPALDIPQCVYRIMPAKNKTSRAIVFREFKVELSFCLESSVASFSMNSKDKMKEAYRGSTIRDYNQIGIDFCLNVLQKSYEGGSIAMKKSLKTIDAFSNGDTQNKTDDKKRLINTPSSKTLFPQIHLNCSISNPFKAITNMNTCPVLNNYSNKNNTNNFDKPFSSTQRHNATQKPLTSFIEKSAQNSQKA